MILNMPISEFVKLVNLSSKAERCIEDWTEGEKEYADDYSCCDEFESIDEVSEFVVRITEEYENKIEDDEKESSYFSPERWHNL